MITVISTPPAGDGFADDESLAHALRAGRIALSMTDNPGLIDGGPVDAIANVLLAALADGDPDERLHWSGVRALVSRIVDSAVSHALDDFANLLERGADEPH